MVVRRKRFLVLALFAALSVLLSCSSPTDGGDSLVLTANALVAHAPDGAAQVVTTLTILNTGASDVTVQPLGCGNGFHIRAYTAESGELTWNSSSASLGGICAAIGRSVQVPAGAYRTIETRILVEQLREDGVQGRYHRFAVVPEFASPRINTREMEAAILDFGEV